MKVKAILNIKVDENGKVSVSVDTDTKKDVSEKDASEKDVSEKNMSVIDILNSISIKDVVKKIKLVDRNAKEIDDAYGLTYWEFKKLLMEFDADYVINNLNNIDIAYEHIIPLVAMLPTSLVECGTKIIRMYNLDEIKNEIDLIEVINNADDKYKKKYMEILLTLYKWNPPYSIFTFE